MARTIDRREPMNMDLRVKITKTDHEQIKAAAKARGITTATLVRQLLFGAGVINP